LLPRWILLSIHARFMRGFGGWRTNWWPSPWYVSNRRIVGWTFV
jgi:hypothetical protein